MARAAVLLDRGGRVGARPVVRRVLDRAAPELLGELAASTDLGLGEEDRPAAARRPAEVLYRVSPRGQRCGCARFRRRGGRDRWARAAPGRRPRVGGAVTVAARSRPTSPPGAASTTSRTATNPPPATPSTTTAPPWPGSRGGVLGLPPGATPADVGRGDGVCEDCRADGLGRDPIELRCEAILAAAVRRGPWARRQLRRLWEGADAAGRATVAALVAAHDARIPAAPQRPLTRRLRATGPVTAR